MVTTFDVSQEIFSIDMLTALKSSLKHRLKHVLRYFRLYGDQAPDFKDAAVCDLVADLAIVMWFSSMFTVCLLDFGRVLFQ